jgi:hypothetical protein
VLAICVSCSSSIATGAGPPAEVRTYVSGLVGEASFSNLGSEPVTLWGCADPYQVEQLIDGEWVRRHHGSGSAFVPVGCSGPLWLGSNERVALPFDTSLADGPLPATLRLAYEVGEACTQLPGGGVECARYTRTTSGAFRIDQGDLAAALLGRARERGAVAVVFFVAGGAMPQEPPLEQGRVVDDTEQVLLDALSGFGIRRLDSPTGGGVRAYSVDADALKILMDHPSVEHLAQLFPGPQFGPASPDESIVTEKLVARFR